MPEEISFLLPSDFIAECDADTVWIDIEFPTAFSKEILEQIKVQMNTFIVVNKYPAKITRKVDSVSAILPLEKTEFEYFLFVDSITTETGLGKFPAHRMKVGPAVIRSEGAVANASMRWMPKIF